MKLLYIFPEELSGRFAREYHAYRLADSLAAAGCDVTLAAAPSARLLNSQESLKFFGGNGSARLHLLHLDRQFRLGPWTFRSSARFFHQLDRHLPDLRPDLAYTMHLKAARHYASRLPLVFEAHEIFADNYPEASPRHRRLLALEREVYRQANAVVAISSYLGQSIRDRFGYQGPLHLQHDGIDEAMLTPAGQSDPRELIYAGSLQPWKGVPVAVAAMQLLPDYHLTIVGGEGRPLEELRRTAPANVTFTGQLSREALRPFLRKAALGLMPNLLEPRNALYTFPLKLLEYSAAGKGIVASRIPALDQLDAQGWIELVPPNSPQALADAVRKLSARSIDRTAAQTWAAQYLWENQGERMRQFLESIPVAA